MKIKIKVAIMNYYLMYIQLIVEIYVRKISKNVFKNLGDKKLL